ncbi:hypothetical protein P168DRAFT_323032 [Aspergillus campestris IBT 28561]|uniref:Vacuolar ATPase assembly protein VMA22 n=1 Tax=Aspergillus campestris (strain IBT 28561) TaxID=1392248 RepID=A0A2I1DD47_ASPC2|nr:uncharacterized protein P168DRAFT_323032 [Aspergillus campestris IBT 28561]PKY07803.1 hypothetical protein P168DRAFT_323032 [Aspergillus campestris IBT 28561]
MTQIPTPPASRASSESLYVETKQSDSSAELLRSLDSLLEHYLHLLDQHQRLQADLSSRLSSGFFSLAQANYTCPPGRHYGADYYDDRMKATRRVELQASTDRDGNDHSTQNDATSTEGHPNHECKPTFTMKSVIDNSEEDQSKKTEDTKPTPTTDEPAQNEEPKPEAEAKPTEQSTEDSPPSILTEDDQQAGPKPQPSKHKPRSSDPIRWYGILVPQSLRSAQKSFAEAVDGHMAELAGVIVEMQAVEKEVTRVRSELGST